MLLLTVGGAARHLLRLAPQPRLDPQRSRRRARRCGSPTRFAAAPTTWRTSATWSASTTTPTRPEFSRWAHVRGRNEGAIVSVEWIRRSPSGRLVPPHDIGPAPDARRAGRCGQRDARPRREPARRGERDRTGLAAQAGRRLRPRSSWQTAMRASTWPCRLCRTGTAARSPRSNRRARSSAWSTRSSSSAEALPVASSPTPLQLRDQVTPARHDRLRPDNAVQAAALRLRAAPGP